MTNKTIADRIIATPVDASGALLHVGDEVRPKESSHTFKIEYFVFDGETWHARAFGASWPCSDLHKVVDSETMSITQIMVGPRWNGKPTMAMAMCGSLRKANPAIPGDAR